MQNVTEEMIQQLRILLQLDSLPTIADPALRKTLTNQFLSTANENTQTAPKLFAIGGGPGSGKSFFYETIKAKGQLLTNSVIHDPDLIMQSIPQYQEDANINPIKAFERWELPARQLAHEILLKALIARFHIVYIRSFALTDSLQFVRYAKMLGYQIDMHMLTCKHDVAISRVLEREKITKRHFSPEILIQRHQAVSQLLPEIMDVSDNYCFYENNNDGLEPVLMEKFL